MEPLTGSRSGGAEGRSCHPAGNIRFVGETNDSHCDRFRAKALRQRPAYYVVQVGAVVA